MSTISAISRGFKLRHQTFKKQTNKQTNNEQTYKTRENSKHVMIAAHTLAVNIF